MEFTNLHKAKESLIEGINKRCEDKIIEPANAELLVELISKTDSITKAIAIAELGTTYVKTGFQFDKRLEKIGSDIKYFKKNEELSFVTNPQRKTHKLIIGDNYDALLNLNITHNKSVDIIYIDPPYGSDSMGSFAKTNYTNSISRDNLLSMLYPRLCLSKQLLTDDGIIYVSIDDKNQAYVKCLMDEIFGEENFITVFTWEKSHHFGKQKINFYSNCESILVYAKELKENGNLKELLVEYIKSEFEDAPLYNKSNPKKKLTFKKGTVKFNIPDGEYLNSTDEKYRLCDKVVVKNSYNQNDLILEFNSRWQQSMVDEEIRKGTTFIVKTSNFAIRTIYAEGKISTEAPKKLIFTNSKNPACTKSRFGENVGTNEEGSSTLKEIFSEKVEEVFSYPKPTSLIKYLISLYHTEKEDLYVLDFFAGSGTTGQAVLELNKEDSINRTFILCTSNDITNTTPNGVAIDVTSKRLKRIMDGKCYDNTSDFYWIKKNKSYGDNLEVLDIKLVHNSQQKNGESPFDVIDETAYGLPKFKSIEEKISWICLNFENTQKYLSGGK